MKTRALVSHYVVVDEDPQYNQDFYIINANENEIGELSINQLKNIHDLAGQLIAERILKS